jgi:hypothetical protein
MQHYEHWETDADPDSKLSKMLDPHINDYDYGYATLQDIFLLV